MNKKYQKASHTSEGWYPVDGFSGLQLIAGVTKIFGFSVNVNNLF